MSYIMEVLTTLFFAITLCFAISYYSTSQMVDLLVSLEGGENQSQGNENDDLSSLKAITDSVIFGFISEILSLGRDFLEKIAQIVYFVYDANTVLVA